MVILSQQRVRYVACLLAAGLLLTLGCGKNPTGPGNVIPFETIRKGSEPLPSPEGFQGVLRDRPSWEALWRKYFSDPIPVVDFQQSMVVAVVRASSPCDDIEIQAIEDLGSRWVVQVIVWYIPGCGVTVLSHHFHFARIPRTDLPVDFVYAEKVRS